ncbi:MAG: SGNH/GDSL hydrolase family protein [Fibrobacteraceae bacterium]|nr:SGNH/GDSL hydrolase family protein [Fibrobacteraceae bacterium]
MKIQILMCLLAVGAFAGIVPNLDLSEGDSVYLSSGAKNTYLTDNFLYTYVSDTSFSFHVGEGPSKLFVTWMTTPYEAWANNIATTCGHSEVPLSDFVLLASANSTTGFDGDWDTLAVIADSPVSSRGILVDFEGKSWLRFSMKTAVSVYGVRFFDASNGAEDTWFFLGTSITQMAFNGNAVDTTFEWQVNALVPTNTPATVFGGIGCVNSTEVVNNISTYMTHGGSVHFWAIEMGTNDAWGGGDGNLSTYISNMQEIIDSAKSLGIIPVIARIIATDSSVAGWQINPKYLTSLDSLVNVNGLYSGPDFYTYFYNHPEELNTDGVHPNATGAASMQRLWAEAAAPIYSGPGAIFQKVKINRPEIEVQGNKIRIDNLNQENSTVALFSVMGKSLNSYKVNKNSIMLVPKVPVGHYILMVKNGNHSVTVPVYLK